ncbi:MAG: hypothetical protein C4520_03495 [Candidatus Abyssobacteria bacterium SURF_5]|uniref:Uncharacterized protein n=1 Tax=Abyssobacteria bacterium (strain SURF_5) TaxID=2093360 RepID=A0A3A4NWC9_ABYX5|nr:MAG: hypothetical protein C4520_03495 [Candidatus Abyssubacteria bacterium SURF_5]
MQKPAKKQPQQPDEHHFDAAGETLFIKLPKGAVATWQTSSRMTIEAGGGILRGPASLFTLGKGTFKINPVSACRVSAVFEHPVYLVSYLRLADIMKNRYVFTVQLRPDWRVNLWPHLFGAYARTGQWPTRKRDYARFFRLILEQADLDALARADSKTRLQKMSSYLSLAALVKVGRNTTARRLAAEHGEKIIRKLLEAEYYPELLAEVDAFNSLKKAGGIVPLTGALAQDETGLKTPFEIARPQRIEVRGRCSVEFMWEYGEHYDGGLLCSSIELTPKAPLALPGRLQVSAPRAHFVLDTGAKTAYGATFPAPLICKGEDASISISNGSPGALANIKQGIAGFLSRRPPRRDPGSLAIEIAATEI